MKKEIKKEWVRNLRSGKYKQGKRFLCKIDRKREERFCCLGVLLDIAYDGDWELDEAESNYSRNKIYGIREETNYSFLGPYVHLNSAGLPKGFSSKVGITSDDEGTLVEMNDKGVSFRKIADWIEKNITEE